MLRILDWKRISKQAVIKYVNRLASFNMLRGYEIAIIGDRYFIVKIIKEYEFKEETNSAIEGLRSGKVSEGEILRSYNLDFVKGFGNTSHLRLIVNHDSEGKKLIWLKVRIKNTIINRFGSFGYMPEYICDASGSRFILGKIICAYKDENEVKRELCELLVNDVLEYSLLRKYHKEQKMLINK